MQAGFSMILSNIWKYFHMMTKQNNHLVVKLIPEDVKIILYAKRDKKPKLAGWF
jgi:hypothetical protein